MKLRDSNTNDRKPAVAGQFYPGSKKELQTELKKLFQTAKRQQDTKGTLKALISPHAGYIFSGGVAASAFNQIPEKKTYKRIFILASSHQFNFGGASVYTEGNYETPLGKVKVDTELANTISQSSQLFKNRVDAHIDEHSLEVQLPFLQYKLGKTFKLIPIVLGTNNAADCKKIAEALRPYFTAENLFVISTDFSHYPDYDDANKIDLITANSICQNKPEELLKTLKNNSSQNIKNLVTSLCGWTSVLTLLYLTENEKYVFKEIKYRNSADAGVFADKKRVVGYWAITVYESNQTFTISEEEQEEILLLARNTITDFLKKGKKSSAEAPKPGSILNQKAGVFVSVYINNELRGCIGGFEQGKSLHELIRQMAISSIRDRRFKAVKHEELGDMKIEVSVLSPLKKIQSADEIELGRHGIFIQEGFNSGTFLPQVIEKTNWDVFEFLGHCSRDKAGLGWEGWKTAEMFTYEAVIIKDKGLNIQ